MRRYNLGDFELSQSYLFFYDSLEKANWFLENVCDLADEPLESRLLTHLFTSPENDGGQWNLAQALVGQHPPDFLVRLPLDSRATMAEKYGLVPKTIFPESYHSSNTSRLDGFLTSKLREHALDLRAIYSSARESVLASGISPTSAKQIATAKAREAKGPMMASIYRILAITLGAPPAPEAKFVWEYNDASGKAHSLESTPLEFYHKHCAGFKADDFVSLINDPRNAYGKLFTVDRLGNVVGGPPVLVRLPSLPLPSPRPLR